MSYSTTLGITVPDATDNYPSSIITLQSGFNTIDTLIGARVKKGGGDTIQASGVGVVPLILKGASGQTAHIQDWQDSNGIALAAVEANGLLRLSNLVNPNITSYLNNPAAVGVTSNNLASPKADNVALAITGFTAQTANLQEWRNSSGTVLSSVKPDGGASFQTATSYGLIADATASGGIGALARALHAAAQPLVVRGYTSQTANLQEWQNSSGTVVTSVNPSGGVSASAFSTQQTSQARYLALDYRGNAVVGTYIFEDVTDATKVDFSNVQEGTPNKVLQAAGFVTVSSKDYKDNVQEFPEGALAIVLAARPVRYNYRAETGISSGERHGFIAEELYRVYPTGVSTDGTGKPGGIDYGALTPLLLKAIQELALKVESLSVKPV